MLTAVTSSSPLQRPAVERLDVLQFVDEPQVAGGDLVVRQGVEHERVVRVRAVADADELLCGRVVMLSSVSRDWRQLGARLTPVRPRRRRGRTPRPPGRSTTTRPFSST